MALDSESFNKDLYDLLKVRGYKPVALNARNQRVEASPQADVIEFTFKKDGEEYGKAWVTIDDASKVVLYYDNEQADSPEGATPGLEFDDSWTGFIKHLKSWAMRRQLDFQLSDKDRLGDDMRHREYYKMKENISEGYYPMGKSASYNDSVPSIKIVLQHTRQIQEGEQRFRNIARIFLENTQGERILAPTTRPGIARVYARHLAEGGLPHDERWNHIGSLVEDYTKMAGFVRATRNKQFNESAQPLINEGINHYESLRETLGRMTGKRGYNEYFENYTPALMETEGDESNLNELFVQETLDPRIESVMPILSRLRKNVGEMKEVTELAEWADSLIEAEGESIGPGQPGIPESEELNEYNTPNELRDFMSRVARYDDPFMMVYRGLTGKYGETVRLKLQDIYDDIAINNNLHPDDDFEPIIDMIIDRADKDFGLHEGKLGTILAGAALIASLWGITYQQAQEVYSHSPQLQKLEQLHTQAVKAGDEAKASELEQRIANHKTRLDLGYGEVHGPDGKPIVPQYDSTYDASLDPKNESQLDELDDPDEYPKGRFELVIDRRIAKEKPSLSMDQRKTLIRRWIQKNMERGLSREEAEKITLKQVVEFGASILSTDPSDTALSKAEKDAGMKKLSKGDIPRKEKRLPDTSSDDLFKILKLGVGLSEDDEEEVTEDLGPEQKKVGQLGPTEKVKNNNIGKLVGANESVELSEMDKSQPSSDRGGESSGNPYAKGGKATPIKAKDAAKDAEKALNKSMDKAHKKDVKESQEERPYVCVHAKKGKCEVTASSSYGAAQKAATKWGLKNTAGIDVHLADKPKDPASIGESKEGQEDLEAIMRLLGK